MDKIKEHSYLITGGIWIIIIIALLVISANVFFEDDPPNAPEVIESKPVPKTVSVKRYKVINNWYIREVRIDGCHYLLSAPSMMIHKENCPNATYHDPLNLLKEPPAGNN